MQVELRRLLDVKNFADIISNIQSLIKGSNLLTFLEVRGRVKMKDNEGKLLTGELLAYEAARSIGYNEAIADIMSFHDIYMKDPMPDQYKLAPDFGGTAANLVNGNITTEEANAIKHGRKPEYTVHKISSSS